MKTDRFYLVSVKPKNSQAQGQIYVVRSEDLSSFIEKNLSSDNILLIDNVKTFVSKTPDNK